MSSGAEGSGTGSGSVTAVGSGGAEFVIRRKWTPFPKQASIMSSDARFRVVSAGRRFGKTELAQHEAVEYGLQTPGSLVWLVFPTYNDALELGYERLRRIIPEALIADKNKSSPPTIWLTNGTTYSFRSADRKDALRGRGVDLVVIDESATVSDSSAQSELRPAVSDTLGRILAIGSPQPGAGWFREWHRWGTDPDRPEFAAFTGTTYDNPHVPDGEVDEAREQLPERVFRQEYLAEFLDDDGAVFPEPRARLVDGESSPADAVAPVLAGVDLARKSNYTALVALDATGRVVAARRRRGVSWGALQALIETSLDAFPAGAVEAVRMDAGRDNKIVSDIEANGYPVEAVTFGGKSKQRMVEHALARFETHDIEIPERVQGDPDGDGIEALLRELEAYEFSVTRGGSVSYGAPENEHDDMVDAFVLAAKPREREQKTAGAWGR